MAEVTPEYLDDGGPYTAQKFRRHMQDFLKDQGGTPFTSLDGGVLSAPSATTGDLAVTQNSTPNMSVNVAAGVGYVRGTSVSLQGAYRCYNDATVNKSITAAHATLPRKDLIVAQVQDDIHDASGFNRWIISVVDGTAAASPSDPTIPASSMKLARVNVAAADTAITNAEIDDLRITVGPAPIARPALSAIVHTAEDMSSTTFGDLATAGPTVSNVYLGAGQNCIVFVSYELTGGIAGTLARMSFQVTGASGTSSANEDRSAKVMAHTDGRSTCEKVSIYTASTSGLHTFTSKYRSGAPVLVTFGERFITVIVR